jgi:hypothetical protein
MAEIKLTKSAEISREDLTRNDQQTESLRPRLSFLKFYLESTGNGRVSGQRDSALLHESH